MKKIAILLFVASLFSTIVRGQSFTQESLAANFGLGFGWYSYGYSVTSLPALSVSVEKGVWNVEDLGIISLGGIAGWKSARYNWSYFNYRYNWSWTDFILAARSAVHPDIIDNEKVDIYGGVALGIRQESYKYYEPVGPAKEPVHYTDNSTHPLIAIYAGGRYDFTDHFGVFGEIGYGLGYFTLGISYKTK